MLFAMSDEAIIAISTAAGSVVTSVCGVVLLYLKIRSEVKGVKTEVTAEVKKVKDANTADNEATKAELSDTMTELKGHVDGKVQQLIDTTAHAAKLEGKEEGKTEARAEAGAIRAAVEQAVAPIVATAAAQQSPAPTPPPNEHEPD